MASYTYIKHTLHFVHSFSCLDHPRTHFTDICEDDAYRCACCLLCLQFSLFYEKKANSEKKCDAFKAHTYDVTLSPFICAFCADAWSYALLAVSSLFKWISFMEWCYYDDLLAIFTSMIVWKKTPPIQTRETCFLAFLVWMFGKWSLKPSVMKTRVNIFFTFLLQNNSTKYADAF